MVIYSVLNAVLYKNKAHLQFDFPHDFAGKAVFNVQHELAKVAGLFAIFELRICHLHHGP